METEEHKQRQGDALNNDPRHKSVELGLDQAGPDFLDLKADDHPLGQIQKEQEYRDLSTGFRIKCGQS